MRKTLVVLLAVAFAVLGLAAPNSLAKEKKAKAAASEKESRVAGTIVRMSKDASTITVRTQEKGGAERVVHYDASTKWTKAKGTKDADMGEFKEGSRVICLGKYDEKKEFMAKKIDLRAPRL